MPDESYDTRRKEVFDPFHLSALLSHPDAAQLSTKALGRWGMSRKAVEPIVPATKVAVTRSVSARDER